VLLRTRTLEDVARTGKCISASRLSPNSRPAIDWLPFATARRSANCLFWNLQVAWVKGKWLEKNQFTGIFTKRTFSEHLFSNVQATIVKAEMERNGGRMFCPSLLNMADIYSKH